MAPGLRTMIFFMIVTSSIHRAVSRLAQGKGNGAKYPVLHPAFPTERGDSLTPAYQ